MMGAYETLMILKRDSLCICSEDRVEPHDDAELLVVGIVDLTVSRRCSGATGDDRELSGELNCLLRTCRVEKGCWPRFTISMLAPCLFLYIYFNFNLLRC